MRRIWTALLAFLGLLCITAAIAIPTYLVPKLKVVPLDLDITSVATTVPAEGGQGEDRFPATIFDRCSITERRAATFGAHLTQQRRSVTVDPSDSSQATVQSAQMVKIDRTRDADGEENEPQLGAIGDDLECTDAMLTASVDRVSVNRKTSAPNGKVSSLQLGYIDPGEDPAPVSVPLEDRKGFQYKFPFNTQKRQYYYYDLNTRQDTVAEFVEETTINGMKVYHFKTEVPETDISDLPNADGDAPLGTILNMPARWWGVSGRGVKPTDRLEMHRFATSERHERVEPITGTIVDGREDQHQFFKSVDDSDEAPNAVKEFRMDALKGTFKWSDETVNAQTDRAKHYVRLLNGAGTWLPIALGVLGALLTLWALLRIIRGRKDGDDVVDDEPDTTPDDDPATEIVQPAHEAPVDPTSPYATTPYGAEAAVTEYFTAPQDVYAQPQYGQAQHEAPYAEAAAPEHSYFEPEFAPAYEFEHHSEPAAEQPATQQFDYQQPEEQYPAEQYPAEPQAPARTGRHRLLRAAAGNPGTRAGAQLHTAPGHPAAAAGAGPAGRLPPLRRTGRAPRPPRTARVAHRI